MSQTQGQRQPFICPFPNYFGRCDKCPFANNVLRQCIWAQKIKPYYQNEREKRRFEPNPNQIRPTSDVVIVGFAPVIKVYTVSFLAQTVMQARCDCGKQFEVNELKCYPHPDGIYVEGKTGKQWVFCKCKKCGTETALWKIFNQLGRGLQL